MPKSSPPKSIINKNWYFWGNLTVFCLFHFNIISSFWKWQMDFMGAALAISICLISLIFYFIAIIMKHTSGHILCQSHTAKRINALFPYWIHKILCVLLRSHVHSGLALHTVCRPKHRPRTVLGRYSPRGCGWQYGVESSWCTWPGHLFNVYIIHFVYRTMWKGRYFNAQLNHIVYLNHVKYFVMLDYVQPEFKTLLH